MHARLQRPFTLPGHASRFRPHESGNHANVTEPPPLHTHYSSGLTVSSDTDERDDNVVAQCPSSLPAYRLVHRL